MCCVRRRISIGRLFLPIIANIAVLTFSVGFKGTIYVTALMLVAVLYLVAWEYDRLKPLLFPARVEPTSWSRRDLFGMPAFFAARSAMTCHTETDMSESVDVGEYRQPA